MIICIDIINTKINKQIKITVIIGIMGLKHLVVLFDKSSKAFKNKMIEKNICEIRLIAITFLNEILVFLKMDNNPNIN